MKLHVLTAVTRPENLPSVANSINAAGRKAPGVTVEWHTRYDIQRQYVGGQRLKNEMLDGIDDGWVCILDDDTVMHPQFLRKIWHVHQTQPLVPVVLSAIVVSQKRTTGAVLQARPENAVVGKIDAGQAVLRRDLIGGHRIREIYAGDGLWLETLLAGRKDVHYMPDILSWHNVLTGIDVSEPPERMSA